MASQLSRRQLLVTGALAGLAVGSAGGLAAGWTLRVRLVDRAHPEIDPNEPPGVLKEPDRRTLVALGTVLAPSVSTPPDPFFAEFVDTTTLTRPGYLNVYRRAARTLDDAARSTGRHVPFADLPRAARDEVLKALLWEYETGDSLDRKLEAYATSRDVSALRQFVMDPMLQHFYRSHYGWAVVGYRAFPGVPPADPRAYTRPLRIDGETHARS